MILNLMRIEDISPEYLLERSFFQFQNNASVPALELRKQHQLVFDFLITHVKKNSRKWRPNATRW